MRKKYSQLLAESINKSSLKATQISELVGVSPEYLSRLKNGKTMPARDNLNEALATVLNIDPVELKAAAYREKIPSDVLDKVNSSVGGTNFNKEVI